jgi:hypothetical protein
MGAPPINTPVVYNPSPITEADYRNFSCPWCGVSEIRKNGVTKTVLTSIAMKSNYFNRCIDDEGGTLTLTDIDDYIEIPTGSTIYGIDISRNPSTPEDISTESGLYLYFKVQHYGFTVYINIVDTGIEGNWDNFMQYSQHFDALDGWQELSVTWDKFDKYGTKSVDEILSGVQCFEIEVTIDNWVSNRLGTVDIKGSIGIIGHSTNIFLCSFCSNFSSKIAMLAYKANIIRDAINPEYSDEFYQYPWI